MNAAEKFEAGDLTGAVAAAVEEVRQKPMEPGPRWRLVEFLCFAGDLERADKQLDTLLTQFPKQSMTAVFYRQLLRAEKSRREVVAEGRLPEFLSQPSEAVQKCLHALVSLRAGEVAETAHRVAEAEALRKKTAGICDGVPFEDLRDVDDLFGPILEVVTADGRCASPDVDTSTTTAHITAIRRIGTLLEERTPHDTAGIGSGRSRSYGPPFAAMR